MEDTTRLVSELLQKLSELDDKVNNYRQDMADEFQRHSRQLLQDIPENVSAQVERVIADKLHNYPAISPGLDSFQNNLGDSQSTPKHRRRSPPPPLRHTSGTPPDDGTSSPHEREREREFHGLFTPSYLPLLDAVQPPNHTPTTSTSPPQPPRRSESNKSEDPILPSPVSPVASRYSKPHHVRSPTEDTLSSVASDDSASRLRRSALRRSSSSSAKTQSPRRVRFDVEGQQVLPTASPPGSPRAPGAYLPTPGSPARVLGESLNSVFLDEDTQLLGNSPPRPKKISSTERLKAMARNSTEDTSTWTVVGNMEDIDDDEDELVMPTRKRKPQAATATPKQPQDAADAVNNHRHPTEAGPSVESAPETAESDTASTGVVEGLSAMPALSSFKGRKRFSQSENTPADESLAQKPAHGGDIPAGSEEEDMFDFEEISDSAQKGGKSKPSVPKYMSEEEDEDEPERKSGTKATARDAATTSYATSPGIAIPQPPSPPRASPPTQYAAAASGSYRGKPFLIGSVKNPEVHKQAAEMGDVYSFVGSVDGRSGVDESSSYRPAAARLNGTPKSLSERLLMEELQTARRNADTQQSDTQNTRKRD